MTPNWLARLCAGRLHYAWIVLALVFVSMLAGVSVRAAPGVMIGPLRRAFGWDVSTISAAISVNIMLMGLIGPFMAGLMQSLGLKRTMLLALLVLMSGTGLSLFMTSPWQLFLTWGVMVGIGAGAGAVGFAGAVANRWFFKRTGFAAGLLFAANAAGQLIFLPLLAWMANRYGWQGVAIGTTTAIACVIPLLFFLLPESPEHIGIAPYGGSTIVSVNDHNAPGGNMFSVAIRALIRAARSADFWLLCVTFGICGLSTNGLINTHLIAYCLDEGIPEIRGASILAGIGLFSLFGSMASGWLCDRYSPRVLLFWVLQPARTIVGADSVQPVRCAQFVGIRGVLWIGLGCDRSGNVLADQRSIRATGRAGDRVVDLPGAPDRRFDCRLRRRSGTERVRQLPAGISCQWPRVPGSVTAGVANHAAG